MTVKSDTIDVCGIHVRVRGHRLYIRRCKWSDDGVRKAGNILILDSADEPGQKDNSQWFEIIAMGPDVGKWRTRQERLRHGHPEWPARQSFPLKVGALVLIEKTSLRSITHSRYSPHEFFCDECDVIAYEDAEAA